MDQLLWSSRFKNHHSNAQVKRSYAKKERRLGNRFKNNRDHVLSRFTNAVPRDKKDPPSQSKRALSLSQKLPPIWLLP